MHMRIAALAALVLIPSSRAADAAKAVAPYLDDQTVAVAHIDLSAVEVEDAAARIAKAGQLPPQLLAGPREGLKKALAAFRDAGAGNVYVVFSMDDLPFPGPFLIVPRTGNDAALKSAFKVLGKNTLNEMCWSSPAVAGGALVLRTVDHLYCIKQKGGEK